jgi:predicted nucleic acid-binding protein
MSGIGIVKVSEAFQPVKRLYMDTAPLIYYVETHPTYIAIMDEVMNILDSPSIVAMSSVILLPEVLVFPVRQGRNDLEKAYRDIFTQSKRFQLIPVSRAIAERSIVLRAQYNLRTPDALHIATAIEKQCDAFLTNDLGLQRVTEIPILVLDTLESDNP